MSELTPGFIVAHSHRLEELTDLVVQLTSNYPLAPLATETMLVQSNGIAQWLKIHLAEEAGIAALLQVTLPARFQWQAYRSVLGQQLPKTSPFDKDRLTWRILRILPAHLQEPEFKALRDYVADDDDQRKLYQLSERLADLYDQYQMYRADWLADWAAGGQLQAGEDNHWQPKLWRYLLADVGEQSWNNRAELHRQFIQAASHLTPATRPAGIPPRIVVFGISSLPQQLLELLDALKGCCQIVLCVHNPCKYHWADIVDGRELLRQMDIQAQRHRFKSGMSTASPDEQLHAQAQPLLAAWGKQGRDYIRLLDRFDETRLKAAQFNELNFELFDQQPTATLLQQLQDDILELRPLEETRQRWPRHQQSDQSVAVHCAHSPQREVEVLHDQLLAAFAADASLKPRDIMVMVPDIDAYAPHIDAVFGRLGRDDERYIPYTIADQGQRHRNPLLIALEQVLTIRQSRLAMSDVLDLLQVPALQRRFGLSSYDVDQLRDWIHGAGVRWGLHAQHRELLGLPGGEGVNSWQFGLRRMLLGYAVGEPEAMATEADSDWLGDEPYSEVAGLEAAAAGGLVELIDTLDEHFHELATDRTPAQWADYLTMLLDSLFEAESDADVVLLSRLQQQLEQWLAASTEAGFDNTLPLTLVIESWLSRLDEQNLQQRFLAGSVNFATLMPMRAIPFRYVCLLGMNDGEYPRAQKPLDFDLMARDYRPGDRSRREDDRYLFLEALLSARDYFYISWHGRSIRDNSERPPSVLVSQLLEHLRYGWQATELVTEHRLQPFSPAYFESAQPGAGQLFTYAQEWRAAHLPAPAVAGTDGGELTDWVPDSPLSAKQLADFLKEPARLLMNQRLGVYFSTDDFSSLDEETFVPDGLLSWQLQQPLFEQLAELLQQQETANWQPAMHKELSRLQGQGLIPSGAGGAVIRGEFEATLSELAQGLSACLSDYPLTIDAVALIVAGTGEAEALSVSGVISGLRANAAGGWLQLAVTASKLTEANGTPRLKHALHHWVNHLLLNTQNPTHTLVLGQVGKISFLPMTEPEAHDYLQGLLDWVIKGYRQPLAVEFGTIYAGWCSSYGKKLAEIIDDPEPKFSAEAAAEFYSEGSAHKAAQVQRTPYVGRFYPDYDALTKTDQLFTFAEQLYLPMVRAAVIGAAHAD
ncbi:exodeoxyribonuclease V subunit gamma [Pseudidiomarina sp.]|uniref:exodeoxyribonuclease V subunit gamma n=1 Tax=Pseudidiomarina sp. TaxID=2081707 RepID=UPI00299EE155|nr:exodeoxyribonuclease V subunit gamma [Pseudidiomarina sp.]MDX1705377.1 exodeoxyribonuclease V subunit gamma [Pseudidiomarina sp.]